MLIRLSTFVYPYLAWYVENRPSLLGISLCYVSLTISSKKQTQAGVPCFMAKRFAAESHDSKTHLNEFEVIRFGIPAEIWTKNYTKTRIFTNFSAFGKGSEHSSSRSLSKLNQFVGQK